MDRGAMEQGSCDVEIVENVNICVLRGFLVADV